MSFATSVGKLDTSSLYVEVHLQGSVSEWSRQGILISWVLFILVMCQRLKQTNEQRR